MKIAYLILAALPCLALAEPITLKGLGPGMTKEQMEELHPGFTARCSAITNSPTYDEACGSIGASRADRADLVTFAGVRATSYTALLKNGVAQTLMVMIAADDFEQAEAAVTERWGKPAERKTGTIQNRMGASFDQIETRWARDGTILRGAKRGGKVDTATFTLISESGLGERDKSRKDAAKKGAKDM